MDDPRDSPEYWEALLAAEGMGLVTPDENVVSTEGITEDELEQALRQAQGETDE